MTRSVISAKEPKISQDYEFLKVIGAGSFGKVYLVKSKSNDRHYAIKVLSKRNILDR